MMTATHDRVWNALRINVAVAFAGAIAGCGGNGSESAAGATPADASKRMHPLAAEGTTAVLPAIAGGGGRSLALRNDGTVYAWGCGAYGQLGNNSTANSPTTSGGVSNGVVFSYQALPTAA